MQKKGEDRIGRRRENDSAESSCSEEDREAKDAAKKAAANRRSISNIILRSANEYNTTSHLLFGIFYIAVGVICFTILEKCLVVTSLYFLTQVITTIGYGDVVPTTNAGKLFISFYALGVILYLGSLINLLIEGIQSKVEHIADTDKKNQQVYVTPRDPSMYEKVRVTCGDITEAILGNCGVWRGAITSFIPFAILVGMGTIFYATYEHCTCSYGIDLIAGCVDHSFEECALTGGDVKTWTESFYMCVITLTTIGFGDFTPMSYLGRTLFIPWAFVGVVCMANFATNFASALYRSCSLPVLKPKVEIADDLEEFMGSPTAKVNRVEFSLFFLQKNNRIPRGQMEAARTAFEHLDKSGKGRISMEDAVHFVKGHLHMATED
jgi:hypothetical protein